MLTQNSSDLPLMLQDDWTLNLRATWAPFLPLRQNIFLTCLPADVSKLRTSQKWSHDHSSCKRGLKSKCLFFLSFYSGNEWERKLIGDDSWATTGNVLCVQISAGTISPQRRGLHRRSSARRFPQHFHESRFLFSPLPMSASFTGSPLKV